MSRSSSPSPAPAPAVLRRELGAWRRDRRGAVVAAVLFVAALAVVLVVGAPDGPAGGAGPGLRGLVTGSATAAAVTAALLTAVAHVGRARGRWFRHVGRLPRLLADVARGPGGRWGGGLVLGVVVATFLHPVLMVALAVLAVAVVPTEVGRAVAVWRVAGAAARARVGGRSRTPEVAVWRATVLAVAIGAAPVALLRLVATERACGLDAALGVGCPDGAATIVTAFAVALGAVAVTPLALGLGDVIARTMEGERLGGDQVEVPSHVDVLAPPTETAAGPVAPGEPLEPPVAEEPAPSEPPVAEEPAPSEPPVAEEPAPSEPRPRAAIAEDVPDLWPDDVPVAGPPAAYQAEPEPVAVSGPVSAPEPLVEPVPVPASEPEPEVASEAPPVPDPSPDQGLVPGSEPFRGPDGERTVEIEPVVVDDGTPTADGDDDRTAEPDPVPEEADALPQEPSPREPRSTGADELPGLFGPATRPRDEAVDAAIGRARPSLEALTPETREVAVSLLAAMSDEAAGSSGDPIDRLRRSLHTVPLDRTRSTLSLVRANTGRVEALRAQYQRSPGIARGAIERAASVGFRAAGLDGEHAATLAATLLTVDDGDWGHLMTALEVLDEELDRA